MYTNQLTGVLHWFRLKPVAFMADIQAMYYELSGEGTWVRDHI